MNAYWLVACIFMVLIGTTAALLFKHWPTLQKTNDKEFAYFMAFVCTVVGGMAWPVVILIGALCLSVWLLFKFINKIIIKHKGHKDAS